MADKNLIETLGKAPFHNHLHKNDLCVYNVRDLYSRILKYGKQGKREKQFDWKIDFYKNSIEWP